MARLGTEVQVEVFDDGAGISADAAACLFERFFTIDRQRGIGPGLAVVRGLLHAHGGAIDVDSKPGSTRFVVRLPL